MPEAFDARDIQKQWVHSHEEDGDGKVVYRPSDYPFPRSRGRFAMTLKPDGVAEVGYPGPGDRARHDSWSWSLEGKLLTLTRPDGSKQTMEIECVDSDVLIVRID